MMLWLYQNTRVPVVRNLKASLCVAQLGPVSSYLLYGLLAVIGVSDSNALPVPILLMAMTRNIYSLFSTSLSAVQVRVFAFTLKTSAHSVRLASRFSMMYPVIGDPPSYDGGFQATVMEVRCTSVPSIGPTGLPGTSVESI